MGMLFWSSLRDVLEELQGDPAVALCALRSEADAIESVSPQLQQAGTGLSGGAEKERSPSGVSWVVLDA